jgi:hypothetical protein
MREDGSMEQCIGTFRVKDDDDDESKKETLDARGDDKLVFSAVIRFKKLSKKEGGKTRM